MSDNDEPKIIMIPLDSKENRKTALDIALRCYVGEPCRICGKDMTLEAVKESVWAGYGQKGRLAHKACWDKNVPKEEWADKDDIY